MPADPPCKEAEFFAENYPDLEIPTYYDNRCRPWYRLQKENPDHIAMTDIYLYESGEFGITACAPFTKNGVFHGAYCYDLEPFSESTDFSDKWFQNSVILNRIEKRYAFFTDEEHFRNFEFDKSEILDRSKGYDGRSQLEKIMNSEIYEMTGEVQKLNTISEFMDEF